MMKTYIGTKIINAKPMTRQEYNDFRGWQLPSDEDGSDEGYLVEYLDGGKPNTSMFAGYVSWSPKEVFEKAYVLIGDVVTLEPHQQRVVAEKAELDAKREKLIAFFKTETCLNLPLEERTRLMRQERAMQEYSAILGERICAFE